MQRQDLIVSEANPYMHFLPAYPVIFLYSMGIHFFALGDKMHFLTIASAVRDFFDLARNYIFVLFRPNTLTV